MQDSKTTCNDSVKNEPKPARNNRIHRRFTNDNAYQEPLETISSDVKDIDWKSYEEESNEFWSKNTEKVSKELDLLSNAPKPKRDAKKEVKGNIFSLLKPTPLNDKKSTTNQNEEDIKSMLHNKLEKHELGCPNESKSFLMLRQIYQNKQLDGLWDLFEKCNGDVNWAIDILLKDDSCVDTQMTTNDNYIENFFNCNCDESNLNKVSLKIDKTNEDKESSPPEKIPRYKSKKEKIILSQEMLEAKRAIEQQIVLGEEHYSDGIKKIRNFRHGIESNGQNSIQQDIEVSKEENTSKDHDDRDISPDIEYEDMIEIDLGTELIKQLESTFNTESRPKYSLDDFKTNIFMPKSLAKQLYALWMESLYNQIEEQKQKGIKEDEEFAHFLQNSLMSLKHSNRTENFKDIMDMDLAWSLYKSDSQNWKNSTPTDLASHLTRLKLYELFPNIEKDTLLEILNAHNNKFSDTVEVLKDTLKENLDQDIQMKEINLLKEVKDENEKVSKCLVKFFDLIFIDIPFDCINITISAHGKN